MRRPLGPAPPLRRSAFVLGLALLALTARPAAGQAAPGAVGLGGQVGDPSGLTLKRYDEPDFAYVLLAAWNPRELFFLSLHANYERSIEGSPLRYYLGPGAFVGIESRRGGTDLLLGLSANIGVNFFVERFEVFLQLTPRLRLVPETEGDFGGGVGLRYYF